MAGKNRRSGGAAILRRRRRPRPRPAAEWRDWADLPADILALIFCKLGGMYVLSAAQAVCRPWRQLALDPRIWRSIDMRGHSDLSNTVDMAALARSAIDRSAGHVEEFYADYFVDDDLLTYIADRTTGLRCLVLIASHFVSGEGLTEFVARCPLLEELQLTNCSFYEDACSSIGRARPELKCFRLNTRWYRVSLPDPDSDNEMDFDREAIDIADTMPQLRQLQLIGNQMTNKGLNAILDKCVHLESLDIRACLNVSVDAGLRTKLGKIKTVKFPLDSTSDYGFDTMEGDSFDGDYASGYSDIELAYADMLSDFSYDDFTIADCFGFDDDDDDDDFPDFLM